MADTNFWSQPVDHDALTLAHAIALKESGNNGVPNYHAVGDAGTSKGAYQWQPGNFEAAAKEAGLNPGDFSPTNQDKVAYYQVYKDKQAGLDPGQIASKWNSGSPDNWQNHSGTVTINGQQIHYDTPAYVKGVQQYYQQLKGSQGGAPAQGGIPGFQPPSPSGTPVAQASGGIPGFAPPQAPQPNSAAAAPVDNLANGNDTGNTLLGGAKAIGNFLFPVVGDVYHDIKGDSSKTGLQQLGDLGLSALPFIPGLGEAGIAGRGAVGAAELAGGAARAGQGAGLLAKLGGSLAAKGAAVGYGTGVSANLSQGKGVGESLMPNVNTITGTVIGGAAPGLIKAAGGIADKFAGISPQIKTELTALGAKADPKDAQLYDQYIQATKDHAVDVRAKAPLTIAADQLDKAAGTITAITKAAGQAVGAAKNQATQDFQHSPEIVDNFLKGAEDRFGIKLTPVQSAAADHGGLPTIDFTGEGGNPGVTYEASKIPGSMRQVDHSVTSRVSDVAEQLSKLPGATVKQANEIISNLYDLVDYSKTDAYGRVNDPLEGLIKSTAHDINQGIRKSSPEIAKANDTFSELKDLQGAISGMAGKDLQKGELLMRRVFSGDKSGDVNDLFQKIKDVTGVDLIKHAVLAKHAIESVGSKADKTLLEQIMEGAVGGKGGLVSGLMNLGKGAAQKTFANPEKIGRKLIKGKSGTSGSGALIKGALEAGRGVAPLVNTVSQ